MELTEEEKHELVRQVRELAAIDVIGREERDAIYRICIVACGNQMAGMRKEKRWD